MNIRTIEDINKKIENGNATVLTAEEISNLVRDGETPKAEDVDVVTTGTCGIMSGTVAVLHVPVADPGAFKKAKSISLNGVPGFPGPCPNEWLGSVDLVIIMEHPTVPKMINTAEVSFLRILWLEKILKFK